MKYVAHRGFSLKNPDNTEQSFLAASKMGFWGIETDLWETTDGVLICHHNRGVEFEDGTVLNADENDYVALTSKSIKNKRTDIPAYVPTFKRYLEICKEGGKVAVIEIKQAFDDKQVLKMLEEIDEVYSRDMCVIISFYIDCLKFVREADSDIQIQYLVKNRKKIRFAIDCGFGIDISILILTPDVVRKFHKKGLEVNVYTINGSVARAYCKKLKTDYITTNVFDK